MNKLLRYAVALVVGIAVTAGVALASPALRVPILLIGIAQVYVVGTAIALRVPEALRSSEGPRWLSTVFAGVLAFGGSALLLRVESSPNIAVATLGWGLAVFGFVTGVAFEYERRDS